MRQLSAADGCTENLLDLLTYPKIQNLPGFLVWAFHKAQLSVKSITVH